MSKIDKIIMYFLISMIPFILILLAWGTIDDPGRLSISEGLTRFFWDFLGWIFMSWILCSLYFVMKMVMKRSFRDPILGKLAGVRERDERESIISGEAAKFSFLSTIAMILFLLFLSIFTVSIGKYPRNLDNHGKKGYISIGVNFYPFAINSVKKKTVVENLKLVSYTGIPLSKPGIIILVLLWMLCSYRLSIYRKTAE